MKYNVYGKVSGTKFLGTFEASSPEEAECAAMKANGSVNLCHQCASECEGPDITECIVEREYEDD